MSAGGYIADGLMVMIGVWAGTVLAFCIAVLARTAYTSGETPSIGLATVATVSIAVAVVIVGIIAAAYTIGWVGDNVLNVWGR